ncbi:copper amine oxidase N-terminal domain-containing protein [Syntrophomonas curvata]
MDKKKFIIAVSLSFLICLSLFAFKSSAMQKILLYINGEEFTDASPVIIDDRVYVPVRSIAEKLGAEANWDEEKQAVRIDSDIKLIASIPEEKIYLYALNKEEDQLLRAEMYKGLILSVNGKKQVFDWETIAMIEDLPQLSYVDLNGDNKKEIAVILSRGRGTGIIHQTVHVINPENFTEYKVENPLDIIKDNVEDQIISDREVKVIINGDVTDVNLNDFPKAMAERYPKTISNIYYENFTEYQITNTDYILRAMIGAEVGPTKYVGFITIDYSFQEGEFKADKISFAEYPSNS